jgi:methionine-rich copper-binding protein CopC
VRNEFSSEFWIRKVIIFVMLLVILSLSFQINSASAHATLVKSDPSRRASLSSPPKHIQLWFNEKIEGAYASVTVLDSNKNSITENSPEVVSDDPKSVMLKIPQIEPGRYTVQYRVMSVDGHVIESNFDFSVKK